MKGKNTPTALQEFVICEFAPNFVFGCTWGILPEGEAKKYKSALEGFKKELGDKIRIFQNNGKVLVDFAPEVFIRIWKEISAMGANMNINEDIDLFNKNRTVAGDQFAKHLKKVLGKGNTFTEQIGLFCVNETDRVQFKNPMKNGETTICPAYRLTLEDVKQIAKRSGVVAHTTFQTIASSATAVIVLIKYQRYNMGHYKY